jgi:hypothetical protein
MPKRELKKPKRKKRLKKKLEKKPKMLPSQQRKEKRSRRKKMPKPSNCKVMTSIRRGNSNKPLNSTKKPSIWTQISPTTPTRRLYTLK